ncbi:hypothetical protein HPC49_10445 [Pyxidicoccus fallax]|uniref:Immunity MXAN-0049 protein domain-containing protein n=1 Tax=Pyxidicoccus fallax TaxID=394095 RepID=A0A848LC65_9BACT|nr:DUF1629 domain-containing protein [Pyxidicoccus fallax]NMO16267.1 hypothetical protein [Pyxidicoccus fallax]NPC78662.1 hypothetical protein [Pyxidicoccus fallax]
MQTDYFVLMRARSQQHPLLAWDQDSLPFLKSRAVEVREPVQLKLGEPVPSKPIMVDHHSLPAPVVSRRLMEALAQLELPGVQWVPADVHVGETVLRYWLVHMWRRISCVDRARSVLSLDEDDGGVLGIDKLVLDEDVLGAVPLEERLAFRLEEAVVHLFHRSVVDRAMSLTPPPVGLRFIPVSDWNDSAGFR